MTLAGEDCGRWMHVRVARRWQEAVDVAAIELRAFDGNALPAFTAGASIEVMAPGDLPRQYSLCGSPADGSRYLICVLRVRRGRGGSIALHDQVRAGDTLCIRLAPNAFSLQGASVYSLLLGAGIGITPLVAMADTLWRRGSAFSLHYTARHAGRAALLGAIRSMPWAACASLHWTESGGRPLLSNVIGRAPAGSDVYACGPADYLVDARSAFATAGRPAAHWHSEMF